jgi:hypothetical protein
VRATRRRPGPRKVRCRGHHRRSRAPFLPDFNCNLVHIYGVWERLEEDWRFELDRDASTLEYVTGVSARFRDGSILHISTWADCCDGLGVDIAATEIQSSVIA